MATELTDEQYERMVESVRTGRAEPIEKRQARWDRIQSWSIASSLAQMAELEEGVSGVKLSRARIAKILHGARPGSVPRPKLPGLVSRQRKARQALKQWRNKPGATAERVRARAEAELATVGQEIAVERKLIRDLGRFPHGKP